MLSDIENTAGPSSVLGPSNVLESGPSSVSGPSNVLESGPSSVSGPSNVLESRTSCVPDPVTISSNMLHAAQDDMTTTIKPLLKDQTNPATVAAVTSSLKRSADNASLLISNEYCGYEPLAGVRYLTERVDANIAPSQFFEQYISARRPAVIKSLTDLESAGLPWTQDYLVSKAGNTKVTVEDHSVVGVNRPAVEMRYRDFIAAVFAGETRYHLQCRDEQSSNSIVRDRNAVLSTVVEPLQSLSCDFPLRPTVCGNLILHQVALSQGRVGSAVGDSTELQHYFHDTSHLLLKGRRRFRLFPPSAITVIRQTGCPYKVHANGLIVYLPAERSKQRAFDVRADGAPLVAVARQKRDDAEYQLIEAEDKLFQLQEAGAGSQPELHTELEKATRTVRECERLVDITSDELDKFYSDYEEEDVISIHDDDSEPEATDEPPNKLQKLSQELEQDDIEQDDPQDASVAAAVVTDEPYNGRYCTFQLPADDTTDADVLFRDCPELKSVGCLVVQLNVGEMLYLPASWFFQMTSYDEEDEFYEPTSTAEARSQTSSTDTSGAGIQTNGTETSGAGKQTSNVVEVAAADAQVDSAVEATVEAGRQITLVSDGPSAVVDSCVVTQSNVTSPLVTINTTVVADASLAATAESSDDELRVGALSAEPSEQHIADSKHCSDTIENSNSQVPGGNSGETVSQTDNKNTLSRTGIEVESISDAVKQTSSVDTVTQTSSVDTVELSSTPATQTASVEIVSQQSTTTASVPARSLTGYLALTYLWQVPDGLNYEQPYTHSFWYRRWQRHETELRRLLHKASRPDTDVISVDSESSGESDYNSNDSDYSEEFDSEQPVFLAATQPAAAASRPAATSGAGQETYRPAASSGAGQETYSVAAAAAVVVVGDESSNDDDDDGSESYSDDVDDIEVQPPQPSHRSSQHTRVELTQLNDNNTQDDIIIMDDDDDDDVTQQQQPSSDTSRLPNGNNGSADDSRVEPRAKLASCEAVDMELCAVDTDVEPCSDPCTTQSIIKTIDMDLCDVPSSEQLGANVVDTEPSNEPSDLLLNDCE